MIRRFRRSAGAALAAAALVALSCAKGGEDARVVEPPARPEEEAPPQVYADKPIDKCDVLVSGFEPFGRHPFNSSWEIASALDGEEVRGKKVRAVLLPVVWGEASKKLTRAIEASRPEVAVGFGMGTRTVQIELAAWNERRAYEDNLGNLPPARLVEGGGPEELHTALPVNGIAAALARLKVKFTLSTDAGGYLCNEVFYALARREVRCAGFVHVPVAGPATPELEELKRAGRAIVEACIEGEDP